LAPFCPTFNRELARKGEAEQVIKGLEEQDRAIPAKVRRLKAKVARQSGRLEALHRVRSDLQMLKQLGREVQEANGKIKQLEKAVIGLQRELEVEEGEHRSTEELVLELREVGEEVQVVDSYQRKVEQLEEKLTELGGKVRECGAGASSLEAVGREVKEAAVRHGKP
jgi:chromosome segregation ATPase